MPVSLQKGQKVDLTKGNPGLTKVVVGVGWDINHMIPAQAFDLDSAAFMLKTDGKVSGSEDFIFYGNLKHPSGAVEHFGDNLTGAGEGDDEQMRIDLSPVPANITKIAFTVTIYDAENRNQNFGQVNNAFVSYNEETGEEMMRYDLGEDFSIKLRLCSVSCTAIMANGNSMPLAPDSTADLRAVRKFWNQNRIIHFKGGKIYGCKLAKGSKG